MHTMRYIKTGISIYDRLQASIDENCVITIDDDSVVEYEPILAEADSIKELCDEFVLVKADGTRIVRNTLEEVQDLRFNAERIYGSIWHNDTLVRVCELKFIDGCWTLVLIEK